MWSLYPTRSLSLHKRISCSTSDVLAVLHDPDQMLRLSPLVFSVVQDPSDTSWYTISERLPQGLLGVWDTQTTFRCRLTRLSDGVGSEVHAGAGTRLKSEMTVKDAEDAEGIVVFSEKLVVQVSSQGPEMLNTFRSCTTKMTSLVYLVFPFVILIGATYAGYRFPGINDNLYILICTLALLLLAASSWIRMSSRPASSDPYGLFHLALNKLPEDDPDSPPATEWLNMGYWKDTTVFPEACKALAMKLFAAGNCKRGGRILDVGHGTGESLILLLTDASVPPPSPPSYLAGITSMDLHHRRSRDRVHRHQAAQQNTVQVKLYKGDAVFDGVVQEHPFHPSSSKTFDTILALDCAYHFNTRRTFLEQSFGQLASGGSIALADICFSSSSLSTLRTKLTLPILRLMPKHNQISTEEYIVQMREIGYIDVVLEDITPDVFPGFVTFLKSRGWGWWVFGTVISWYASAGARFVIVSGKRPML
ncbi:hypothetical protein B0H34DRAFT_792700 [Crassisporium funariophilum]|nr:hypothetical protein B0H34DRAFT_792700 [Crassisporium funariophilum]